MVFLQDDNPGTRSHLVGLAGRWRAIGSKGRSLVKRISRYSAVRTSRRRVRHVTRVLRTRMRRVSGRRAMGHVGRRLVKRVSWPALARQGRRLMKHVNGFSVRRIVKGSTRARRLWICATIARHPWEYYSRLRIARKVAARPDTITIPRAAGFVRFDSSHLSEVSEIVRLCRTIYEDDKRHTVREPPKSSIKQKGYLIELLTDDDLLRYPQLVDFCLSPPIVGAVTRYLGTVPVLRRVGLWLSFAAPADGASRLFHLDPEDFTQARLFLNVIDIAEGQGPLTFLPADVSSRVLRELWTDEKPGGVRKPQLRRWRDEEILARSGVAECVQLVGPAGSGALVDTSRCVHYGSRMKPGTMHLVFQAQFLRYHFQLATAANRFDRTRAGGDPLLSRLLVRRPGYECNWHDR